MTPVLDASVFIAAISPVERHYARARQLFDSHPDSAPFLVPDLFRLEVSAALARRGESAEFLDVVDALVRGPRFFQCPLDEALLEVAVRVARDARLAAYDAVYVALALVRDAPLFTLDAEVASRTQGRFPDLAVIGAD